jgi:hypothetical protein
MAPSFRSEYAAYLKSDTWRETRARFFNSLKKQAVCYCCNASGALQLHHRNCRSLGCERLGDLVALCDACHSRVHRMHETTGIALWASVEKIKRWNAEDLRRRNQRDIEAMTA